MLRAFTPAFLISSLLFFSCGRPRPIAGQPPAPPSAETERGDSPREAAEFFRRQVLGWDSTEEVPVERFQLAQQRARAMRRYSVREGRFMDARIAAPTSGAWEYLGPNNIGGRTRALVIHPQAPNVMWAAAATGGIWKTTDSGASWSPVGDFSPALSTNSLIIDPANSDILYAGTGEYTQSWRGAGIYKTADGGQTWSQLAGTANSNFYYVNRMAISPNDSSHIYAATASGIWFSADAGETWQRQTQSSNVCFDLVMSTSQPTEVLLASCLVTGVGTPAGSSPSFAIFRNDDGAGQGVWTRVHSEPQMSYTVLAVAPSRASTVYAVSVTTETGKFADALWAVYRSTESGAAGTWETRVNNQNRIRLNTAILSYSSAFSDICGNGTPDFQGQGDYNIAIAVDPLDPERVWAAGIYPFRSDDGGANWGFADGGNGTTAHSDQHFLTFHPNFNGADNQILYLSNDGGVYRTTQARGATAVGDRALCTTGQARIGWTAVNHNYATTQFYHGDPYRGGSSYFGGTQDNGTLRGYEARGADQWSSVFGGDGGVSRVDPLDPNVMYYEYVYLAMRRSLDGGATSSPAINGITENPNNFTFINYYTFDPANSLRLYTGGTQLWRTEDAAYNWAPASAPNPKVGTANDIITAIAVSPTDSNLVIYATNRGRIYRNPDALAANGKTDWPFAQPRSGNVSQIAFDPRQPSTVYATYTTFKSTGSDSHIYKSTDAGLTWFGSDGTGATGLPDVPARTLLVDPDDSNQLYLGTDIGLFASVDGGATWARDDNPFANVMTRNLVIDRNGGAKYLYAFTYGRGVWRAALPGGAGICTYSVSPVDVTIASGGGTASVDVATSPGCAWSGLYVSNPSTTGISIQSPAGGTGSGRMYFTAAATTATAQRIGTFSVQNQIVTVRQLGGTSLPASNDELITAANLATLPVTAFLVNNSLTQGVLDPAHSCTGSAGFKTAWWTFTAPADGPMAITAQGSRSDVSGNSGIAITAYPLNGVTIGSELACATIAKSTGTVTPVTVSFAVKSGSRYAVEISALATGAVSDNGTLRLSAAMALPVMVKLNPSRNALRPGQTLQFEASVANVSNAALRWTISPQVGSITPEGFYTAPAQVDSTVFITVTAQSMASGVSGTASLTVQPDGASANIGGLTHAASFQTGPVAAGEIITLFGADLGPAALTQAQLDSKGRLATALAGTQVLFDGTPAPLIYVSARQTSVVVPYEVSGQAKTQIVVVRDGRRFEPVTVGVMPVAPALFTADGSGSGQAVVVNQDNSTNTPSARGSVISLFGSGEGQTDPAGVNGQIAGATLPRPLGAVRVTIGGVAATVMYAGGAPQATAGLLQLNVRVPTNIPTGPNPVVVTVGSTSSRTDVTLQVK